ncbi:hypothetical protein M3Y97_00227500 [Aphelenchoides bicaudatus]|nr:hypothetical protein M3Y97_00227500 [Aphelenchoides bicaudatus]
MDLFDLVNGYFVKRVVVELLDGNAVEGQLILTKERSTVHLKNAVFHGVQGVVSVHLNDCYIRSDRIRFIHFDKFGSLAAHLKASQPCSMTRRYFLFVVLLCFLKLIICAKFEPVTKNRCEIKLVADYAFYKRIGNGNYANCARYLVNMIERVNAIFTAVDWGLSSSGKRFINMGFTIKEMKILDRPSDVPGHYNSEFTTNSNKHFSAMDVLKAFSSEEGTPSACLTILLSGKVFDMSILGMANIAKSGSSGICAKTQADGIYWNTGIVTVQRRTDLMITRVVDLVFAHEMGHLWGAVHDDLNDPECRETEESNNGRFIMHESSNSGYDNNNYKFSRCSIQSIYRLLYDVSDSCFVNEQTEALCGNGILEPGEECDPGGQLSLGHSSIDDPCCTATCHLRTTAKCSPKHSECCSDTCSYLPRTTLCQPKSTDNCKQAAYCSGISDKCPEPKSIADGTTCTDEGKCKNGECLSYCQVLSPRFAPCTCENVSESCFRCCRTPTSGNCVPIEPRRNLPEGSICIHGQCRKNICVKEATDAATHFWRIIKDIGANPSPKYFADYIVVVVIFASLLIWCPCGFYILYRDHQKQKSNDAVATTPRVEDVYFVPTRKRIRRLATGSS